jgi:hypothetical protein
MLSADMGLVVVPGLHPAPSVYRVALCTMTIRFDAIICTAIYEALFVPILSKMVNRRAGSETTCSRWECQVCL